MPKFQLVQLKRQKGCNYLNKTTFLKVKEHLLKFRPDGIHTPGNKHQNVPFSFNFSSRIIEEIQLSIFEL